MTQPPHASYGTSYLPSSVHRIQVIRHASLSTPIRSAQDFAGAMNCDLARVAKTILLVAGASSCAGQGSVDNSYTCVVLSSEDKIDLQAVSSFLEVKKLRLATASEVEAIIGVRPGAVSPLYADKLPILIDAGLLIHDSIFVSGGEPGIDVEINPKDLARSSTVREGCFMLAGDGLSNCG